MWHVRERLYSYIKLKLSAFDFSILSSSLIMPPRKKAADSAPAAPTRSSSRTKAAAAAAPAPAPAAPAAKPKSKGKRARANSDDEEDAPAKKPVSKKAKKSKAVVDEDPEEEQEEEVEEAPKPAKMKQVIKRGAAPVDETSGKRYLNTYLYVPDKLSNMIGKVCEYY